MVLELFGVRLLIQGMDFVFLAFCLFFVVVLIYLFIAFRKVRQKLNQMNTQCNVGIDKALGRLDYFHKLFDKHFKVTDQTIIDVRKERDELKEEVKRLKKLVGEK